METKATTYLPKKAIRPFLTQLLMYLGVTVVALLLLDPSATPADYLLCGVLAVGTLGYGILQGHAVFGTSLRVQGETAVIRIRGSVRAVRAGQIACAYYDSNSRNMELHTTDGNILMLVEYDDLSGFAQFLDAHGVRIEYKRIVLK